MTALRNYLTYAWLSDASYQSIFVTGGADRWRQDIDVPSDGMPTAATRRLIAGQMQPTPPPGYPLDYNVIHQIELGGLTGSGFSATLFREGASGRFVLAVLTLWMTFVPSFALVFAGAPHVDRIAANDRLRHALAALNAVVLAAIAQLAGWYGWTVLVADGAPRWPLLAALVVLAAWRWRFKPSAPLFVGVAALAGLLVAW